MSVIESDITAEEANTFVQSVAHRLELYSIAEQIHFAKSPFDYQLSQPLPSSCLRLKNAFVELMVTRSNIAECPVSNETAFEDLLFFLDNRSPGIEIPIFELADMPHLNSHEDIRVGISMALRSAMHSATANQDRSVPSLFVSDGKHLYPRLQLPIPVAGSEVQPRQSNLASHAFLFGRLLALSLAFNVQIPDVFPDVMFSSLCGGRYFIDETLSILTTQLDAAANNNNNDINNNINNISSKIHHTPVSAAKPQERTLYRSSPVILHQAMRLHPTRLTHEENLFYQKIFADAIHSDILLLANIANTVGNNAINIADTTANLIAVLEKVSDFDITEYSKKFMIYTLFASKSDVLKEVQKNRDQIASGKAFLAFYREVRTGFRTVFAAPSLQLTGRELKTGKGDTTAKTSSSLNATALKLHCKIDSLLHYMNPRDLKLLLVHPLKITPNELSRWITPQRSDLKLGKNPSLQATVDFIKKFIYTLGNDSHDLLESLVVEATGFPYLTGVAIQVGGGPKPYLLPTNLVEHADTHPTWARLMRSVSIS